MQHVRWRLQRLMGKPVIGPACQLLQQPPVETRTGVLFASRGNVFVASNMGNGIVRGNRPCELRQRGILRGRKGRAFKPFEFNANGIVIALAASTPARLARMPGAIVATDELQNFAGAPHHEMGRHLQTADLLEIGVRVKVERVGEQLLDLRAAIFTGRQADGMHHQQVNLRLGGTGAEIG